MTNPWIIDPLHMTLRLVLALLLGGMIGLEREQKNHPAGFRTHILVCLGAALVMLLSIYGFRDFVYEPNVRIDPARLAAQVIAGIGFLGAGTIVFNGFSISGLTTAASLWVVAAIGLAVGAGFYYAAVMSTLFVLLSLWVLNKVEKRLFHGKRTWLVRLEITDEPGSTAAVLSAIGAKGGDIRKVTIEEKREPADGKGRILLSLDVWLPRQDLMLPLAEQLRQVQGVSHVSLE